MKVYPVNREAFARICSGHRRIPSLSESPANLETGRFKMRLTIEGTWHNAQSGDTIVCVYFTEGSRTRMAGLLADIEAGLAAPMG